MVFLRQQCFREQRAVVDSAPPDTLRQRRCAFRMKQKHFLLVRLNGCHTIINNEIIGLYKNKLADGLAAFCRVITSRRVTACHDMVVALFETKRTRHSTDVLPAVAVRHLGDARRIRGIPMARQRLVLHANENRIVRDRLRVVEQMVRRVVSRSCIQCLEAAFVDDEAVFVIMLMLINGRASLDGSVSISVRET